MNRFWTALALAGASFLPCGTAQAEPVKIAVIETLSGGQAAVGKMFLTAINYGLIKVNDEKAWPDGIVRPRVRQPGRTLGGRRQGQGRHQRRRSDHRPGRVLRHRRPDHRRRAQAQPAQSRQGNHLPQRRCRGDGVHRLQVPLLSLPLERQRRDPAAGDADGDEGHQDAGHQGVRDRPELQLGPRCRAPGQGVRQVRRLHRGRRRHPRRQQDPGFLALRRPDQGGQPGHGHHRQLEQRSAPADEGGRRFRPQGALRHVLDGPAGQRGQRRRDGHRPLQRLELLPRGQRRRRRRSSPTTSRPRRGSIRCSFRDTPSTASGVSARR